MIVHDQYVSSTQRASEVLDRTSLEALDVTTGGLAVLPVRRFADGTHACFRIRTTSCEAIVSNNALVWPEGRGYILAQAAAGMLTRIRVLVDGDIRWEPVIGGESVEVLQPVVSLVVPDGLLAVGISPTARIFTTENRDAAPSIHS